jgi:RNA polymerase sigma-70 factor (ECF subfamily)
LTFHSFDAEYVQRLTNGDAVAENHFAFYFGELLYLKLRARLRSRQLIEDVRQETLLRVLQTLRRKGGVEHPERFGAFVNAVCNNVLLEFCRSERRHDALEDQTHEPADPHVDLDEPLVDFDRKRQVQAALSDLPEKDRNLLRSIFLEETDKSEICRRYRVEGDYLRVLLHRAKARFRRAYVDRGGSP